MNRKNLILALMLNSLWIGFPGFGRAQILLTEKVIRADFQGATCIAAADFNGDGFKDLVVTASTGDKVGWFENDGNQLFTEHIIIGGFNGAKGVAVGKIDGNETWDLVATAKLDGRFSWFGNNGSGQFTEHVITDSTWTSADYMEVDDLDQDGDPDILGACFGNDEIRWWENINTFILPGFTSDSIYGQNSLRAHFQDLSVSKPAIKYWAWDFDNDGVTDSYDQNPYHDFVLPGYYTVRLRVASDSLTDSIVRQDCIRVFDGESALEFNGADSRMLCEQGTILNITGPFSFEAWIRPDGFGATGIWKIFDKSAISFFSYRSGNVVQSDTCLALIMTHQGGKVSTVATPSGSLKLTEWQHVAVTYHDSSSRLMIFIDGAEQPLEIVNPPEGPVSGNELKPQAIGNAINGNMAFTGCIDECRLWSVERTPEVILEWMDFDLPDGQSALLGYWKLNEGNCGTAYDHSEIGRRGKLQKLKWAQGVHLATLSVEEEQDLRERPVVIRVQPNPASGMVTFSILSEIRGEFRAAVFNSNGLKVTDLPSFRCQRNREHILTWDCRTGNRKSCPPGVYFLTLTTGNTTVTEKIIII